MKIHYVPWLAAALVLVLASDAPSQAPQPARTSLQALQLLKAQNQQLLEKQDATLKKLEEMQLQAQQLKFFGKRS